MTKILYLATQNMRSMSGGGLANKAFYNAICEAFPDKVEAAMSIEYCQGEYKNLIPIPSRTRLQKLTDFSLHRYRRFMKSFLRDNAHRYSVCVVNGSINAGNMMDLIHSYGIRVIVIHHNYEVDYYMSNKGLSTIWGTFPPIIKWNERNAYRKADMNLYLTESDSDKIKNAYGIYNTKNYVIGMFESEQKKYNLELPYSDSVVSITGSLGSYQTYRSIYTFGKEYYEKMIKEFPNISIILAGKNPNQVIWDFQEKNPDKIKVIANPKDMNEILAKSSIYLCPTYLGSGIKLRIMDGLRNGRPVLTHKVSARGYENFIGKPYFQVYEDPETFIIGLKTIIDYLKEDHAYQNIQNDYEHFFSFENGVQRMKKLVSMIYE